MRSLNRFEQMALFIGGLLAGLYAPSLLMLPTPQPLGYLLIAIALAAFSILAIQIGQIDLAQPITRIPPQILPILVGILLAGSSWFLLPLIGDRPWPILTLWGAGWAAILVGAWLLDRAAPIEQAQQVARWEVYVVAGLTIAALLIRGIAVDTTPFSVHGDEGEMGMVARSVMHGELTEPFVTAWLDHPTLWFFLQALALRLFGDTMGGLRLFSAIIGAATIPICYLFTRESFSRRVALIATILLAGYHFHIHFSRIGLNNIVDPLMALIAFAAFLRGWRTGSFLALAVAGTAAGLAQHFYMGARLILVIIALLLLHQAIVDRATLWARMRGLLLMGLAFFAGFGPLLRFFLEHPNAYMARLEVAGFFQTGRAAERMANGWSLPGLLLDQANRSFGAYLYTIDTGLFYAPAGPLLDPLNGALFLCGLGLAIVSIKRLDRFLLLAWVGGAAVFGGMLLIDPPQSPRYLIAAPAICVLIALGLNQAALLLRKFVLPARLADATLGGVAVLLAISSLSWYFLTYTPLLRYGGTRDLTTIAYYINTLAPDRYPIFLGPPYAYINHGAIAFLTNRRIGSDALTPLTTPEDVPAPPPSMRLVFIALSARSSELAVVQARYPGGQLVLYEDPLGLLTPLIAIYEAP